MTRVPVGVGVCNPDAPICLSPQISQELLRSELCCYIKSHSRSQQLPSLSCCYMWPLNPSGYTSGRNLVLISPDTNRGWTMISLSRGMLWVTPVWMRKLEIKKCCAFEIFCHLKVIYAMYLWWHNYQVLLPFSSELLHVFYHMWPASQCQQ